MRFNADRFNDFLGRIGQAVQWRRALACPCVDPDTGSPNIDCTACQAGVIWLSPVDSTLALAGQKAQQRWKDFGQYVDGDVVCTLAGDQPVYALGRNDRVLFMQSSQPFSQRLVNTGAVALPFPVQGVDSVIWLNSDLSAPVTGGPVTVGTGGVLGFGAPAPPAGAAITVSGRRMPEYYCFDEFPQDRAHQGGDALPRRVVLRRFDLFKAAAQG